MICDKCGFENADENLYCVSCGESLIDDEINPINDYSDLLSECDNTEFEEDIEDDEDQPFEDHPTNKKSVLVRLSVILAIIIVLSAIFVPMSLYYNSETYVIKTAYNNFISDLNDIPVPDNNSGLSARSDITSRILNTYLDLWVCGYNLIQQEDNFTNNSNDLKNLIKDLIGYSNDDIKKIDEILPDEKLSGKIIAIKNASIEEVKIIDAFTNLNADIDTYYKKESPFYDEFKKINDEYNANDDGNMTIYADTFNTLNNNMNSIKPSLLDIKNKFNLYKDTYKNYDFTKYYNDCIDSLSKSFDSKITDLNDPNLFSTFDGDKMILKSTIDIILLSFGIDDMINWITKNEVMSDIEKQFCNLIQNGGKDIPTIYFTNSN